CQEGGQSFSQSSNLVVQHQLHAREKPYKGLESRKSFNQSSTPDLPQQSHWGTAL
ncbi:ZN107 protein, partial [Tyrannus savana]|nr:ZN107 protein [Tyrannus savana]